MSSAGRAPVIFGTADGVITVLGLLVGLLVSGQSRTAVWHAALAAGTAAFVGMTSGRYLSENDGWRPAVACGLATFAGTAIPAVPYLFAGGWIALTPALALVCVIAGVVAWLRPERSVVAVMETYGVLAAAALLSAGTALLLDRWINRTSTRDMSPCWTSTSQSPPGAVLA